MEKVRWYECNDRSISISSTEHLMSKMVEYLTPYLNNPEMKFINNLYRSQSRYYLETEIYDVISNYIIEMNFQPCTKPNEELKLVSERDV